MSYWCFMTIHDCTCWLLVLQVSRRFLNQIPPKIKPMLNFAPSIEPVSTHLIPRTTIITYCCFVQTMTALSSCPTDVLDKSWLPCWCWFFKRRYLKLFPKEAHIKTLDPKCSDPIDLWTTFWTNLNPNLQRIIYATFGQNWHSCFRGED